MSEKISRGKSILRRGIQPAIETLEGRRLLSVSLSHHGLLHVNGTRHADTISISPNPNQAGMMDVTVNDKTRTYDASKVSSINVNAGGGDDTVTEDASITQPSTLLGGAGNDTLIAGNGNDTILGGSGNDSIQCGTGHDNVDGGKGSDHVAFSNTSGVPIAQVPTAVATGLTTLAQGATVTTVQSFSDDGQTYYGAVVPVNGQDTRIVVDANGNPITSGNNDNTGHDNQREDKRFGTVVSVDTAASKITLTVGSEHGTAKQTTFGVDPAATVTVDGAASTLSSLTGGVWVAVQTSTTDPTVATAITVFGHRAEGIVSAVDNTANTITLQGHDGAASTTYKLGTGVAVTVDDATSALSAVVVGDKAELRLSALDPTTAIRVDASTQANNSGQTGGGTEDHQKAFGSIGSVDTGAGSVMLSIPSEFGPATQSTFTLAAGATVTVDGVASTIDKLTPGETVSWVVSTTDPKSLTAITAVGKLIEGHVTSVDTAANTITIQDHESNATQTLTVANGATVTRDGAASTLGSIVAGDEVRIQFSAVSDTTVTSIRVDTHSGGGGDGGGGGQGGGGGH